MCDDGNVLVHQLYSYGSITYPKLAWHSHNFLHFVRNFLQQASSWTQISVALTFCCSGIPVQRLCSDLAGLTKVLNASKIQRTFFSMSLSPTLACMPEISRHPLLEYSSLLRYFRSGTTSLSERFIIYIPRNKPTKLKFAEFRFQLAEIVFQFI